MLKNHNITDPFVRQYFGFDMESPDDELAWRRGKLKRLEEV